MKKSMAYGVIGALLLAFGLTPASADQQKPQDKYYGKHLCGYPGFTCMKVKRGDSWKKLFPSKRDRNIVMRLNRTNMPIHNRQWIVVPTDLSKVTLMDLAPFPSKVESSGDKRTILVNLSLHAFGAYDENGHLVYWGPVSGGKGYCADTRSKICNTATGAHTVFSKKGKGCRSSKFPVKTGGGAPMPYCMHYYRGFALHGSTLPGYHASHGCIRLFTEDAKWLNQHFARLGTRVIVINE